MQLLGNYSIFMHVYREVVSKQTFPICTQHNFASYAHYSNNSSCAHYLLTNMSLAFLIAFYHWSSSGLNRLFDIKVIWIVSSKDLQGKDRQRHLLYYVSLIRACNKVLYPLVYIGKKFVFLKEPLYLINQ